MKGGLVILKKDIKNFEGRYEIRSNGEVYSHISHKVLKPRLTKTGYHRVHLGANTDYYIHRLVAEAFIPNPNHYTSINHKDEDKANNDMSNLEWCDVRYNNNYRQQT